MNVPDHARTNAGSQGNPQGNPQREPQYDRRRNRTTLIALFAIFFGALALAGALRFSGWRPAGMKNFGELLDPPGDVRAVVPVLVEGGEYRWNPAERLWRIVVVAPADCAQRCVKLSQDLELVRELFAQESDRVHILWVGPLPLGAAHSPALRMLRDDPRLRAGLPRVDDPAGVPVYVIDPNGFVILRYAPGFDPGHLRTDLSRLLKLK